MPKYVCTADEARDFSKLGRVEPGQVVESDENPDGAFFMQAAENAPRDVVLIGGFEAATEAIAADGLEPASPQEKPKRATRKAKDGDV